MSAREQAQAMEVMLGTSGWQLVEGYIRRRIEASKHQLMSCPLEEVPKHRAAAVALNSVLLHVEEILSEVRQGEEGG